MKIRILVLLFALTVTGFLQAGGEKLSPELQQAKLGDAVEVIVQYRVAPTEMHHLRIAGMGGHLRRTLDGIKGAHYSLPVSAIQNLASDPDVAYISPDRPVKGMLNVTSPTVNADDVFKQYGLDGSGVGVAVIDSGVKSTADFKSGRTNAIVYTWIRREERPCFRGAAIATGV